MLTELYWIEGPWRGRLAISARPRAGDWLSDEIRTWRAMGVDVVLSLLTVEESEEMNLQDEERVSRQNGVVFLSFPIVDRDAPALDSTTTCLLEQVDRDLTNGKNVLVHCRQGVGRSGLIAAALLVVKGLSPNAAIQRISQARHVPVPETKQQRNWIDSFAANLSPTSQARAN